MKFNYYVHFLVGIAAIVVVWAGLALATYTLSPGRAAVLVGSGNRVVGVRQAPGLYWKVPLLGSVVRVDARTRLSEGTIRPETGDAKGAGITYSVAWRVADPGLFFKETNNHATEVRSRISAALAPALRKEMAKGEEAFLTVPTAELRKTMAGALAPVAKKTGIAIVGIYPGTANIPDDLNERLVKAMTAGTEKKIAAAEKAVEAERSRIAAEAAGERATVMSAAEQEAARLDGASQAKVTAIYAKVAAEAPAFFRYYLALESESAALKSHTKVFVISTDSPWLKALRGNGGGKEKP